MHRSVSPWPNPNPNVDAICNSLKRSAAIRSVDPQITRAIEDPAELYQLWLLESPAFGSKQVPYEQLLDRWRAFPEGITVLLQSGQIIGSIEIWPLSPDVANRFCSGQITEHEIDASPMTTFRQSPCANWYLSGMMLQSAKRHTRAIHSLVAGMGAIFVDQFRFRFPLTILALGYSREGIRCLHRFGFRKQKSATDLPDRCPLYSIQIGSWKQGFRFFTTRRLVGDYSKAAA